MEAEDLAFAWKLQAKEEELVEREQAEQATTEREELREKQAARNRRRKPHRQTALPSKRGTTGVAAAASEVEVPRCTICLSERSMAERDACSSRITRRASWWVFMGRLLCLCGRSDSPPNGWTNAKNDYLKARRAAH